MAMASGAKHPIGTLVDALITGVLVLSALAAVGVFVYRELRGERRSSPDSPPPPEFMADWDRLLSAGVRIGPPNARITIVEFADLECPACRQFHRTFRALKSQFSNELALVFVHFPLPQHRFAKKAAQAAECAEAQGRFAEFVEQTFEQQDSLGLKSWSNLGREAGVPNGKRFDACLNAVDLPPRIGSGVALARDLSVRATPTVILNGWRFHYSPDERELTRVITALLAGRRPFDQQSGPGR